MIRKWSKSCITKILEGRLIDAKHDFAYILFFNSLVLLTFSLHDMSSELLSPAFLINGILALVLKTTNYNERVISKIRRKYSLLPYNCRKTHTILFNTLILQVILRCQVALAVKNSPASSGDKRCRFNPCVRKIPWGRT